MPNELTPCPYCGCAEIDRIPYLGVAKCSACLATANIETWNRRAPLRVTEEMLRAGDGTIHVGSNRIVSEKDFFRAGEIWAAARDVLSLCCQMYKKEGYRKGCEIKGRATCRLCRAAHGGAA